MNIRCKICGSGSCKNLIYPQGILKCTNCGCTFRSTNVNIEFYHESDYWYKGDEGLKLHQRARYAWFEDYILNGDSIEFGAADGDFTYLVRRKVDSKYRVFYSEIKDLLRMEYSDCNISKYIGSIESYRRNLFYLNVFLVDVVEHINDIRETFGLIYKMLTLGGRFFISTNDGDSFDAHIPMFYHLEHTCMLTRKAFEILTKDFGFKIIRYFKAPQNWIYVILEKI